MKAEEFAAIREDIERATIGAYLNGDPSLLPDLLNRLLTELGQVAQDAAATLSPGMVGSPHQRAEAWAGDLLRSVQTRAISSIPHADTPDDEPEDHRDQPTT